jgi:hypothetical protein
MSDDRNDAVAAASPLVSSALDRWRTLTPLQLAREAISNLFVDTEIDELDRIGIAEALVFTGLNAAELDRIYYEEVAPVCNQNYVTTGVWPAFDQQWLNDAIEKQKNSWAHRWLPVAIQNVRRKWHTQSSLADWEKIRNYVADPQHLQSEAKRLRAALE